MTLIIPTQKTDMKPLRLAAVKRSQESFECPSRIGMFRSDSDQRWDFVYSTSEDIKDEIEDFFNHHDFPLLKNAQNAWIKLEIEENLEDLVPKVTSSDSAERVHAATQLLYLSMGKFGGVTMVQDQIQNIVKFNRQILDCGGLQLIYRVYFY
jgi:hypothetical protein